MSVPPAGDAPSSPSTHAARRTYVVKFSDDAELTLQLSPSAFCSDLIEQVRQRKHVPSASGVRLIAAGRELRGNMPLAQLASSVLHCSITEAPPGGPAAAAGSPADQPHALQPPAAEPVRSQLLALVDSTDPGMVLLFILGSVLVLTCCILLHSDLHLDTRSLVILAVMASIFFMPHCLGHIMSIRAAASPHGHGPPSPAGTSGAQAAQGSTARSTGGMFIPARPRPQARPPT